MFGYILYIVDQTEGVIVCLIFMITTSNGEQIFFVAQKLIRPKPCKRRVGEYVKNVGVYCTRYIVNDQPITLECCVFSVYI